MKTVSFYKNARLAQISLIIFLGFLAGVVNGLLGAGGGILTVYALSYALKKDSTDKRDIYANALCVMLPVSAVSCIRYASAGALLTDGFWKYALPAILGGIAGGFLLSRLKASFTKKLFASLVIWSGIILIIK